MSMAWIAIGSAVVGAGASIYGANKQAASNAAAQQANLNAQDRQNNASWSNWLMTRGVAPTGPVVAGQMPGAYTPVNTRLPLWASVNMTTGPSRWQKTANYGQPNTLAITPPIGGVGVASADGAAPSRAQSVNPSTGQKIANVLDPLNVSVGKNKSFLDPLGLFCWVAREIYGEENPRWKQFREWLLNKAPVELREAYRTNGPLLAQRIRNSPALRDQVRDIMDRIFVAEIEVDHA